ncbi:MAG TPA: hypothetical protein VKP60_22625 [Magnetospirillaceae bacterium]|nr:hypothetical protein [Magnetospirillaceae bacterium]
MMLRPFVVLALLAAVGARAESGITQWSVPPYIVTLKTNLDDARPADQLTVLADGKQIYRLEDAVIRSELTFGGESVADDLEKQIAGHDPETIPGHDVLGLGIPNLVFAAFSGGMHCCFKAVILMLDQPFRTQTIDLYDAGGDFHPVDQRKSLILEATDAHFKEWRSSPADSPFPTVMLSFDRAAGRYVADAELMRGPLPDPESLARRKDLAREAHKAMLVAGFTDYEPGELTSPMLDLIYSGHIAEARAFLAESWADSVAKRDAYWSLLTRCKLRGSDYWPAVAKINGLAADPPAAECGRVDR